MTQQNGKVPMFADPYRGCTTIVERDERSADCSLRSPDSNAPCPIPPTIAVASWTPTTQSGVIEGTVLRVDSLSDPTPKPIRDAQVVAAGTVQRTTVVDTAGHFRLSGLPDGDYAFTVRGIGFPTRRDSLRVRANGFTGAVRLRTNVVLFPNCCRLRYCL